MSEPVDRLSNTELNEALASMLEASAAVCTSWHAEMDLSQLASHGEAVKALAAALFPVVGEVVAISKDSAS